MKTYYTQTGIMWGLRVIAVFSIVFATLLAIIFKEPSLLALYLFSLMIYLMSFIGKISKILFYDDVIDVKVPAVRGKYSRNELQEIVIYGRTFSHGRTNIDLYFVKNDSKQKKGVRIQSNIGLIKELLIGYNGKIKIEIAEAEKVKEQLLKLGATAKMF